MRHQYPEAFAELIAVAKWYEAELHSLGMCFQDEIERVCALLRNSSVLPRDGLVSRLRSLSAEQCPCGLQW